VQRYNRRQLRERNITPTMPYSSSIDCLLIHIRNVSYDLLLMVVSITRAVVQNEPSQTTPTERAHGLMQVVGWSNSVGMCINLIFYYNLLTSILSGEAHRHRISDSAQPVFLFHHPSRSELMPSPLSPLPP